MDVETCKLQVLTGAGWKTVRRGMSGYMLGVIDGLVLAGAAAEIRIVSADEDRVIIDFRGREPGTDNEDVLALLGRASLARSHP